MWHVMNATHDMNPARLGRGQELYHPPLSMDGFVLVVQVVEVAFLHSITVPNVHTRDSNDDNLHLSR